LTNKAQEIKVLIPDGHNCLMAIRVVNCLTLHKNVKIYVLSFNSNSKIRFSKSIRYHKHYSTISEIETLEVIKQELLNNKINVILPIEIEFIKLVSKFNKEILKLGVEMSIDNVENISITNDKWRFYQFLKNTNFSAPKSASLHDYFKSLILEFPILIKPKISYGGLGILKIDSNEELKSYARDVKLDEEYFVQEMVDGETICFNVLCKKGKILASTMHKGKSIKKDPYGTYDSIVFIQNEKIFKMNEQLFKKLNWTGVANVDLIYNEKKGTIHFLEINPRFWGSIEGSAKVGVNFPYLTCLLSSHIDFEKQVYKMENYYNYHSYFKQMTLNLFGKDPSPIQNTSFEFFIKDPLPITLFLASKRTKRLACKIKRKLLKIKSSFSSFEYL